MMFLNKMRMLVVFTASVGLAEALFPPDRRLSTKAGSGNAKSTADSGDELGNAEPESASRLEDTLNTCSDAIERADKKIVDHLNQDTDNFILVTGNKAECSSMKYQRTMHRFSAGGNTKYIEFRECADNSSMFPPWRTKSDSFVKLGSSNMLVRTPPFFWHDKPKGSRIYSPRKVGTITKYVSTKHIDHYEWFGSYDAIGADHCNQQEEINVYELQERNLSEERGALASAAVAEPIYAVFRVEEKPRLTPGDRSWETYDIAGTLTLHISSLSREDTVQVSVNMRFAMTPSGPRVQLSTPTGEPYAYGTTIAKALTAAAGLPRDIRHNDASMQFTVVWARDTTGRVWKGRRGMYCKASRRPLSQKLERLGLKQRVIREGKDVNVMEVLEKEVTWDCYERDMLHVLKDVQVSDAIVWEVPRTKEVEIDEWLDKYGQE